MYIEISQNRDLTRDNNYKKYTLDELAGLVREIAGLNGINKIPEIIVAPIDDPGQCRIIQVGKKYLATHVIFNSKVLDGATYSRAQIEEIIKHELAHAVATDRHNSDCHHDKRWQEIAKELGCNPVSTLGLTNNDVSLHIDVAKPLMNPKSFYLLCSQCNSICLETDDFVNTFQFFLLSGSGSKWKFSFGDLEVNTSCCDSSYKFHGDADMILEAARDIDGLGEFCDAVRKTVEGEE